MFYQKIILGMIQGIAEWLPVSSEGLIFLTSNNLFKTQLSYQNLVQLALFLHLGTFLAALVYFRQEILRLERKLLFFLITTTFISGALGFLLLKTMVYFENQLALGGQALTLGIGFLLLITGGLQLKAKKERKRDLKSITSKDILLLGIAQGLASLPGLSRSGLTVSVLLLSGFEKSLSLKLSFLMSLPIVLAGNILLNLNSVSLSSDNLVALLASFIFGLLTIHLLLKAARKLNFGLAVIAFGLLTIASLLF